MLTPLNHVRLAQAYETRTWSWPFKVLEFKKTAKRRSATTAKQVRLTALERATKMQEMLDSEAGLTRAELARRLGISRARVTQILNVLTLSLDAIDPHMWECPLPGWRAWTVVSE